MQYAVIQLNNYIHKFIEKVNAKIAEGWEPVGGVCATTHQGSGAVSYYQAMVKRAYTDAPIVSEAADATSGAVTLATNIYGEMAEYVLTGLQEKHGRRVTKADVRTVASSGGDHAD